MKHGCNLPFVTPVLLWTECGFGGGEEGKIMQYFPFMRGPRSGD